MEIKYLDNQFVINDDKILESFYVDFIQNKYIFNVFVDKKYIESEMLSNMNNIDDIQKHFNPIIKNLAIKHVQLITSSLSKEQFNMLTMTNVIMQYIKEFYSKKENTTWLCFQCAYALFNEKNQFFGVLKGMHDMFKYDFIEPIKVTNELKEKYSDLLRNIEKDGYTAIDINKANELLSQNII